MVRHPIALRRLAARPTSSLASLLISNSFCHNCCSLHFLASHPPLIFAGIFPALSSRHLFSLVLLVSDRAYSHGGLCERLHTYSVVARIVARIGLSAAFQLCPAYTTLHRPRSFYLPASVAYFLRCRLFCLVFFCLLSVFHLACVLFIHTPSFIFFIHSFIHSLQWSHLVFLKLLFAVSSFFCSPCLCFFFVIRKSERRKKASLPPPRRQKPLSGGQLLSLETRLRDARLSCSGL